MNKCKGRGCRRVPCSKYGVDGMGELLNLTEAAKVSGMCYSTIRKAAYDGRIPLYYAEKGKRRYIDATDLYYYCKDEWERGRLRYQYPPNLTQYLDRIRFFVYGE